MTTGVSEDLSAQVGRRIQPTFGYYRQKNGWITISPITRLERVKYLEEGWQQLGQYGAFDLTTYVISHPFEALFMFGGAHEMPVEQLLQTGLYLDPPMVPTCKQHITQYHRGHNSNCWRGASRAEFPQLATVPKEQLGPFPCEFCERKLPTQAARSQHQQVAHKEAKSNIQLGRTLGDSLSNALENVALPRAASSPEAQRIAELEAELARLREVKERRRANVARARAKKKEMDTSPA